MLLKILSALVVVVSLASTSHAQYISNYALYERKVQAYGKLKNAGISLAIGGVAMTIAGAVLTSSADWETYNSYNGTAQTTTDSEGVAGVLLIVTGVPVTVTGVILGAIGARKSRYYQEKLQRLSLNLKYNQHQQRVVLTYRF